MGAIELKGQIKLSLRRSYCGDIVILKTKFKIQHSVRFWTFPTFDVGLPGDDPRRRQQCQGGGDEEEGDRAPPESDSEHLAYFAARDSVATC